MRHRWNQFWQGRIIKNRVKRTKGESVNRDKTQEKKKNKKPSILKRKHQTRNENTGNQAVP